MAVTPDSFTEGRLRRRLGTPPARLSDGAFSLPGANLARLSLSKAQFAGADLRGADLHGCDLTRANLLGASLLVADLSGAVLHQADLRGADLREADLRRAALSGTAVTGSRWHGVRLDGAVLRDVAVWHCDLALEQAEVCGSVTLGSALRDLTRDDEAVPLALAWCRRHGTPADLPVLRARLHDRAWRAWRKQLQLVVAELDRRSGAISRAAISRAAPEAANPRSLSRTPDGPDEG